MSSIFDSTLPPRPKEKSLQEKQEAFGIIVNLTQANVYIIPSHILCYLNSSNVQNQWHKLSWLLDRLMEKKKYVRYFGLINQHMPYQN